MIFDKEETKNLLKMFQSKDEENSILAFKALSNVETTSYKGELIVLYKFGNKKLDFWKEQCPSCYKELKTMFDAYKNHEYSDLSTGTCLSIMTNNIASNQSIELFMEMFSVNMMGFLGQMGYPAEKFEINIKLKNGQSANSQ